MLPIAYSESGHQLYYHHFEIVDGDVFETPVGASLDFYAVIFYYQNPFVLIFKHGLAFENIKDYINRIDVCFYLFAGFQVQVDYLNVPVPAQYVAVAVYLYFGGFSQI